MFLLFLQQDVVFMDSVSLVGGNSRRAIPPTSTNTLDGTDCLGLHFFGDGFGGQNLQKSRNIQNY